MTTVAKPGLQLCVVCVVKYTYLYHFIFFFASYLLVLPKKLGSQLTTQLKRGTATGPNGVHDYRNYILSLEYYQNDFAVDISVGKFHHNFWVICSLGIMYLVKIMQATVKHTPLLAICILYHRCLLLVFFWALGPLFVL